MRLPIERKSVKVYPDPKRVIARFFFNGEDRGKEVIKKVLELSEEQIFTILSPLLQEYSKRHRSITKLLSRHFDKVKFLIDVYNRDVKKHSIKSNKKDVTDDLDADIKWTRAVKNDLKKALSMSLAKS